MLVAPVFGLGRHLALSRSPSHCPSSLVSFPFLFCLCVCCHGIVGLVLCLCDRVVSLWNSGGGLCWVEGRAVYGEWALAHPPLSFFLFLFLFVLVFGVVRAQPCEHARNPRTPLRLSCYVLFSLLTVSFSRPAFLCLEWRWGIHHVSVCCVGMIAMGSLSRSSSFFW